jgi:hypothetical protein
LKRKLPQGPLRECLCPVVLYISILAPIFSPSSCLYLCKGNDVPDVPDEVMMPTSAHYPTFSSKHKRHGFILRQGRCTLSLCSHFLQRPVYCLEIRLALLLKSKSLNRKTPKYPIKNTQNCSFVDMFQNKTYL